MKRPGAVAIARLQWLAFGCLLLFWAVTAWPHAWRTLNTDFPNYYITAHLARQGSSTARVYEWLWFHRQKDALHLAQPQVAMGLITPFSTLVLWPVAGLDALAAKHMWLVTNGVLLLGCFALLRRLTTLSRSRLALLFALSLPLERNLLYGQFYILLLFLLLLACWLQVRQHSTLAGAVVAVAAGLKIFPALFLLYFLRKKDARAAMGFVLGAAVVAAISIAAFGIPLNRLYLTDVLPWGLRGETGDPYALGSQSIPALLHALFMREPGLNPRPLLNAPLLVPILQSLIQGLLLWPALLLATPRDNAREQVAREWALLLLASLCTSTAPASYHFVLLLLPVAVLLQHETENLWRRVAAALLFVAVGLPWVPHLRSHGLLPLLMVPRLYALIGLYGLACVLLWRRCARPLVRHGAVAPLAKSPIAPSVLWTCALVLLSCAGAVAGLRHVLRLPGSHANRFDLPGSPLLASQPQWGSDGLHYIAMHDEGYRVEPDPGGRGDQLAHAVAGETEWIAANDEEAPTLSADAGSLLFVREDHGRGRLFRRALPAGEAIPLASGDLDVYEAAFAPDGAIVFAATADSGEPHLYWLNMNSTGEAPQPLGVAGRYPSVSPDGRWLVFSEHHGGVWQLRLLDRSSGGMRHLTDADCNAVEPSWAPPSPGTAGWTLLYASDCGRGLGLTAIDRLAIQP